MAFCKYCGQPVADQAAFCAACGKSLAQTPAQPVAAPAQPVAAPAQPVAAPAQPVAAPAQQLAQLDCQKEITRLVFNGKEGDSSLFQQYIVHL